MAKALGMKGEDLNEVFDGAEKAMNMYYYPKYPQEVEGLHIKKDGAWIPITPLPNAFVINVGDMLEQ
ncbi:hypothetical protein KY285_010812 [Solanum tuberosum]|nr:hypothetical protein KY289_011385 [Solanum tuberosum]KAH0735105.1 hypothetical protein KY285_010812 [Solanum tuberosum]